MEGRHWCFCFLISPGDSNIHTGGLQTYLPREQGSERAGNLLQVTQEIHSKSGSELKVPDTFPKITGLTCQGIGDCHGGVVMGVDRFKSRVVGFRGILAPPTSSLWALAGDTAAPPMVSPP